MDGMTSGRVILNCMSRDVVVVQRPMEFLEDLLDCIYQARERVYIEAMIFESGEEIDRLGRALLIAVKRGIDVRLVYDWVSWRNVHNKLELLPELRWRKRKYNFRVHARTRILLSQLQAAGVKVFMINSPTLLEHGFPVINRNHSKIYIVDDRYAWVGGVNLFDKAFAFADCMVRVSSSCLIQGLVEYFLAVSRSSLSEDYSVSCGDDYKLYFDSGKHGKSLIYETGLGMIRAAKSQVIFISQFVPNGPLLRVLLERAAEGVEIVLLTSSAQDLMFTGFPYKFFSDYSLSRIKRYPTIKFAHHTGKVHAKLLIVDKREILIGSHNMAFSGVLFGTSEVSLWSRDGSLVKQLREFAEEVLGD